MVTSAAEPMQWLRAGDDAFDVMLEVIRRARQSVRLETYIFAASPLGDQFRAALIEARQRGVEVKVLIDAFGSLYLPDSYWQPLRQAGGEARWFNPFSLDRFGIRDHRKLLVGDEDTAIIGGYNIAPEYQGDGIHRGWRDLGLRVSGPSVAELAKSFDWMFARADYRHQRLARLRKRALNPHLAAADFTLLLSGPGRGFSSLKHALHRDLDQARSARIASAYFLPTWRIRRALARLARGGGRVQLLLAGLSDVPLAQQACRRLYHFLLRAGVEIYEYQPQILHAKIIIIDEAVYAGSANLDIRSLRINYDLMLRLHQPALARQAGEIFDEALQHSRRIEPKAWDDSRSVWDKLKERWAYFLLARVDPYLAQRQMHRLR